MEVHTFVRPDKDLEGGRPGDPYRPGISRYPEGARYSYLGEAHDLVLFWDQPSAAEIAGFRDRPVTVALHTEGPVGVLLYRIDQVCEWSDVAFNIHLVPEAERELPAEPPGERGRLRLTLVDCETGLIRAKRLVSLDKVMTQALRHVTREQLAAPFDKAAYDAAVARLHARFPDSDALAAQAEFMEATLG